MMVCVSACVCKWCPCVRDSVCAWGGGGGGGGGVLHLIQMYRI